MAEIKIKKCWRCKTNRRKLEPFKDDLTGNIAEGFWQCIDWDKTRGKCEKRMLKIQF